MARVLRGVILVRSRQVVQGGVLQGWIWLCDAWQGFNFVARIRVGLV